MLERAASFEGKTVSKFILNSALDRARRAIKEHDIMNLNSQDSELFFNALARPVRFNSKLMAAFEEHERHVTNK